MLIKLLVLILTLAAFGIFIYVGVISLKFFEEIFPEDEEERNKSDIQK